MIYTDVFGAEWTEKVRKFQQDTGLFGKKCNSFFTGIYTSLTSDKYRLITPMTFEQRENLAQILKQAAAVIKANGCVPIGQNKYDFRRAVFNWVETLTGIVEIDGEMRKITSKNCLFFERKLREKAEELCETYGADARRDIRRGRLDERLYEICKLFQLADYVKTFDVKTTSEEKNNFFEKLRQAKMHYRRLYMKHGDKIDKQRLAYLIRIGQSAFNDVRRISMLKRLIKDSEGHVKTLFKQDIVKLLKMTPKNNARLDAKLKLWEDYDKVNRYWSEEKIKPNRKAGIETLCAIKGYTKIIVSGPPSQERFFGDNRQIILHRQVSRSQKKKMNRNWLRYTHNMFTPLHIEDSERMDQYHQRQCELAILEQAEPETTVKSKKPKKSRSDEYYMDESKRMTKDQEGWKEVEKKRNKRHKKAIDDMMERKKQMRDQARKILKSKKVVVKPAPVVEPRPQVVFNSEKYDWTNSGNVKITDYNKPHTNCENLFSVRGQTFNRRPTKETLLRIFESAGIIIAEEEHGTETDGELPPLEAPWEYETIDGKTFACVKHDGKYIIAPAHCLNDNQKFEMSKHCSEYADIYSTRPVQFSQNNLRIRIGTRQSVLMDVKPEKGIVIGEMAKGLLIVSPCSLFDHQENIISGTPIFDASGKFISIITKSHNNTYAIVHSDRKITLDDSTIEFKDSQKPIVYGSLEFGTKQELNDFLANSHRTMPTGVYIWKKSDRHTQITSSDGYDQIFNHHIKGLLCSDEHGLPENWRVCHTQDGDYVAKYLNDVKVVAPMHFITDNEKNEMSKICHHYPDAYSNDLFASVGDWVKVNGEQFEVKKNLLVLLHGLGSRGCHWYGVVPTFHYDYPLLSGTPVFNDHDEVCSIITKHNSGNWALTNIQGETWSVRCNNNYYIDANNQYALGIHSFEHKELFVEARDTEYYHNSPGLAHIYHFHKHTQQLIGNRKVNLTIELDAIDEAKNWSILHTIEHFSPNKPEYLLDDDCNVLYTDGKGYSITSKSNKWVVWHNQPNVLTKNKLTPVCDYSVSQCIPFKSNEVYYGKVTESQKVKLGSKLCFNFGLHKHRLFCSFSKCFYSDKWLISGTPLYNPDNSLCSVITKADSVDDRYAYAVSNFSDNRIMYNKVNMPRGFSIINSIKKLLLNFADVEIIRSGTDLKVTINRTNELTSMLVFTGHVATELHNTIRGDYNICRTSAGKCVVQHCEKYNGSYKYVDARSDFPLARISSTVIVNGIHYLVTTFQLIEHEKTEQGTIYELCQTIYSEHNLMSGTPVFNNKGQVCSVITGSYKGYYTLINGTPCYKKPEGIMSDIKHMSNGPQFTKNMSKATINTAAVAGEISDLKKRLDALAIVSEQATQQQNNAMRRLNNQKPKFNIKKKKKNGKSNPIGTSIFTNTFTIIISLFLFGYATGVPAPGEKGPSYEVTQQEHASLIDANDIKLGGKPSEHMPAKHTLEQLEICKMYTTFVPEANCDCSGYPNPRDCLKFIRSELDKTISTKITVKRCFNITALLSKMAHKYNYNANAAIIGKCYSLKQYEDHLSKYMTPTEKAGYNYGTLPTMVLAYAHVQETGLAHSDLETICTLLKITDCSSYKYHHDIEFPNDFNKIVLALKSNDNENATTAGTILRELNSLITITKKTPVLDQFTKQLEEQYSRISTQYNCYSQYIGICNVLEHNQMKCDTSDLKLSNCLSKIDQMVEVRHQIVDYGHHGDYPKELHAPVMRSHCEYNANWQEDGYLSDGTPTSPCTTGQSYSKMETQECEKHTTEVNCPHMVESECHLGFSGHHLRDGKLYTQSALNSTTKYCCSMGCFNWETAYIALTNQPLCSTCISPFLSKFWSSTCFSGPKLIAKEIRQITIYQGVTEFTFEGDSIECSNTWNFDVCCGGQGPAGRNDMVDWTDKWCACKFQSKTFLGALSSRFHTFFYNMNHYKYIVTFAFLFLLALINNTAAVIAFWCIVIYAFATAQAACQVENMVIPTSIIKVSDGKYTHAHVRMRPGQCLAIGDSTLELTSIEAYHLYSFQRSIPYKIKPVCTYFDWHCTGGYGDVFKRTSKCYDNCKIGLRAQLQDSVPVFVGSSCVIQSGVATRMDVCFSFGALGTHAKVYSRISGIPKATLSMTRHRSGVVGTAHFETSSVEDEQLGDTKIWNINTATRFYPQFMVERLDQVMCADHYIPLENTCNSPNVYKPEDIDLSCLDLKQRWVPHESRYELTYRTADFESILFNGFHGCSINSRQNITGNSAVYIESMSYIEFDIKAPHFKDATAVPKCSNIDNWDITVEPGVEGFHKTTVVTFKNNAKQCKIFFNLQDCYSTDGQLVIRAKGQTPTRLEYWCAGNATGIANIELDGGKTTTKKLIVSTNYVPHRTQITNWFAGEWEHATIAGVETTLMGWFKQVDFQGWAKWLTNWMSWSWRKIIAGAILIWFAFWSFMNGSLMMTIISFCLFYLFCMTNLVLANPLLLFLATPVQALDVSYAIATSINSIVFVVYYYFVYAINWKLNMRQSILQALLYCIIIYAWYCGVSVIFILAVVIGHIGADIHSLLFSYSTIQNRGVRRPGLWTGWLNFFDYETPGIFSTRNDYYHVLLDNPFEADITPIAQQVFLHSENNAIIWPQVPETYSDGYYRYNGFTIIKDNGICYTYVTEHQVTNSNTIKAYKSLSTQPGDNYACDFDGIPGDCGNVIINDQDELVYIGRTPQGKIFVTPEHLPGNYTIVYDAVKIDHALVDTSRLCTAHRNVNIVLHSATGDEEDSPKAQTSGTEQVLPENEMHATQQREPLLSITGLAQASSDEKDTEKPAPINEAPIETIPLADETSGSAAENEEKPVLQTPTTSTGSNQDLVVLNIDDVGGIVVSVQEISSSENHELLKNFYPSYPIGDEGLYKFNNYYGVIYGDYRAIIHNNNYIENCNGTRWSYGNYVRSFGILIITGETPAGYSICERLKKVEVTQTQVEIPWKRISSIQCDKPYLVRGPSAEYNDEKYDMYSGSNCMFMSNDRYKPYVIEIPINSPYNNCFSPKNSNHLQWVLFNIKNINYLSELEHNKQDYKPVGKPLDENAVISCFKNGKYWVEYSNSRHIALKLVVPSRVTNPLACIRHYIIKEWPLRAYVDNHLGYRLRTHNGHVVFSNFKLQKNQECLPEGCFMPMVCNKLDIEVPGSFSRENKFGDKVNNFKGSEILQKLWPSHIYNEEEQTYDICGNYMPPNKPTLLCTVSIAFKDTYCYAKVFAPMWVIRYHEDRKLVYCQRSAMISPWLSKYTKSGDIKSGCGIYHKGELLSIITSSIVVDGTTYYPMHHYDDEMYIFPATSFTARNYVTRYSSLGEVAHYHIVSSYLNRTIYLSDKNGGIVAELRDNYNDQKLQFRNLTDALIVYINRHNRKGLQVDQLNIETVKELSLDEFKNEFGITTGDDLRDHKDYHFIVHIDNIVTLFNERQNRRFCIMRILDNEMVHILYCDKYSVSRGLTPETSCSVVTTLPDMDSGSYYEKDPNSLAVSFNTLQDLLDTALDHSLYNLATDRVPLIIMPPDHHKTKYAVNIIVQEGTGEFKTYATDKIYIVGDYDRDQKQIYHDLNLIISSLFDGRVDYIAIKIEGELILRPYLTTITENRYRQRLVALDQSTFAQLTQMTPSIIETHTPNVEQWLGIAFQFTKKLSTVTELSISSWHDIVSKNGAKKLDLRLGGPYNSHDTYPYHFTVGHMSTYLSFSSFCIINNTLLTSHHCTKGNSVYIKLDEEGYAWKNKVQCDPEADIVQYGTTKIELDKMLEGEIVCAFNPSGFGQFYLVDSLGVKIMDDDVPFAKLVPITLTHEGYKVEQIGRFPGFSGSPIVNSKGRVVGLYGMQKVAQHIGSADLPIDTTITFTSTGMVRNQSMEFFKNAALHYLTNTLGNEERYFYLNSPTGSGKSTMLPYQLLMNAPENCKILLLQPTTTAVKNTYNRIKTHIGTTPKMLKKYHLSYRIGNSNDENAGDHGDGKIVLTIMTCGKFLAMSKHTMKCTLETYNYVLLDECHLITDITVVQLDIMLEHLCGPKLLKMTATSICTEQGHNISPDATIQDTAWTIDEKPLQPGTKEDAALFITFPQRVFNSLTGDHYASKSAFRNTTTLVFCRSHRECNLGKAWAVKLGYTAYAFYHGSADMSSISDIKEGDWIFGTEIVQQSVTIPSLGIVVDLRSEIKPSIVLTKNNDKIFYTYTLASRNISHASAKQRKGRTGRTRAGTYFYVGEPLNNLEKRTYEDYMMPDLRLLLAQIDMCEAIGFYSNKAISDALRDLDWITPQRLKNHNAYVSALKDTGKTVSLTNKLKLSCEAEGNITHLYLRPIVSESERIIRTNRDGDWKRSYNNLIKIIPEKDYKPLLLSMDLRATNALEEGDLLEEYSSYYTLRKSKSLDTLSTTSDSDSYLWWGSAIVGTILSGISLGAICAEGKVSRRITKAWLIERADVACTAKEIAQNLKNKKMPNLLTERMNALLHSISDWFKHQWDIIQNRFKSKEVTRDSAGILSGIQLAADWVAINWSNIMGLSLTAAFPSLASVLGAGILGTLHTSITKVCGSVVSTMIIGIINGFIYYFYGSSVAITAFTIQMVAHIIVALTSHSSIDQMMGRGSSKLATWSLILGAVGGISLANYIKYQHINTAVSATMPKQFAEAMSPVRNLAGVCITVKDIYYSMIINGDGTWANLLDGMIRLFSFGVYEFTCLGSMLATIWIGRTAYQYYLNGVRTGSGRPIEAPGTDQYVPDQMKKFDEHMMSALCLAATLSNPLSIVSVMLGLVTNKLCHQNKSFRDICYEKAGINPIVAAFEEICKAFGSIQNNAPSGMTLSSCMPSLPSLSAIVGIVTSGLWLATSNPASQLLKKIGNGIKTFFSCVYRIFRDGITKLGEFVGNGLLNCFRSRTAIGPFLVHPDTREALENREVANSSNPVMGSHALKLWCKHKKLTTVERLWFSQELNSSIESGCLSTNTLIREITNKGYCCCLTVSTDTPLDAYKMSVPVLASFLSELLPNISKSEDKIIVTLNGYVKTVEISIVFLKNKIFYALRAKTGMIHFDILAIIQVEEGKTIVRAYCYGVNLDSIREIKSKVAHLMPVLIGDIIENDTKFEEVYNEFFEQKNIGVLARVQNMIPVKSLVQSISDIDTNDELFDRNCPVPDINPDWWECNKIRFYSHYGASHLLNGDIDAEYYSTDINTPAGLDYNKWLSIDTEAESTSFLGGIIPKLPQQNKLAYVGAYKFALNGGTSIAKANVFCVDDLRPTLQLLAYKLKCAAFLRVNNVIEGHFLSASTSHWILVQAENDGFRMITDSDTTISVSMLRELIKGPLLPSKIDSGELLKLNTYISKKCVTTTMAKKTMELTAQRLFNAASARISNIVVGLADFRSNQAASEGVGQDRRNELVPLPTEKAITVELSADIHSSPQELSAIVSPPPIEIEKLEEMAKSIVQEHQQQPYVPEPSTSSKMLGNIKSGAKNLWIKGKRKTRKNKHPLPHLLEETEAPLVSSCDEVSVIDNVDTSAIGGQSLDTSTTPKKIIAGPDDHNIKEGGEFKKDSYNPFETSLISWFSSFFTSEYKVPTTMLEVAENFNQVVLEASMDPIPPLSQRIPTEEEEFYDADDFTYRWCAGFNEPTRGVIKRWGWFNPAYYSEDAFYDIREESIMKLYSNNNDLGRIKRITSKQWEKIRSKGRYSLPKRVENLGETQIAASRGLYKAQQIYEADPSFFDNCKHIMDPACGYGGFEQFLSINNKEQCVWVSTLLQKGHRQIDVANMTVQNSNCRIINMIPDNNWYTGDIKDSRVRLYINELFERLETKMDMIIFDIGEFSETSKSQNEWWKKQPVSKHRTDLVSGMKDLIESNLKKGGKMVLKFTGFFTGGREILYSLLRRFKKLRTIKIGTSSYFSGEYYILASNYMGKDAITIKDFDIFWKIIGLQLLESFQIARCIALGRSKQPVLFRNNWVKTQYRGVFYQPYSEADYPNGYDFNFKTNNFEYNDQWRPQWKERIDQFFKFANSVDKRWSKARFNPTKRADFKNLKVLGHYPMKKKITHAKHTKNKFISDMLQQSCGINDDNSTVGHTQSTEEFREKSIKKKLDVNPGELSPLALRELAHIMELMLTEEGKRNLGQCRLLTEEEVLIALNYNGATGIISDSPNIREFINKHPNWYNMCMELCVNKWRDGRPTHSYCSIMHKNEPKVKKNAEDGKLTNKVGSTQEELAEYNSLPHRYIQFFDEITRLSHYIVIGDYLNRSSFKKFYKGTINGTPPYLVGKVLRAAWDLNETKDQRIYHPGHNPISDITIVPLTKEPEYYPDGYFKLGGKDKAKGMCADYSGLDGTITVQERYLEAKFVTRFYPTCLYNTIMNMFKDMCYAICITHEGDVYLRDGQRGSGELITSTGNTAIVVANNIRGISKSTGIPVEELLKTIAEILLKIGDKIKKIEICKVITFSDGDDTVVFSTEGLINRMHTHIEVAMSEANKVLRSQTSSGPVMHDHFSQMDFCSHRYESVIIGPNVNLLTVRGQREALQLNPQNKLWWLPIRPVADILGKLRLTLKNETMLWDPKHRSHTRVREITTSKVISYLLLYPHVRLVRLACLLMLSHLGVNLEPYQLTRKYSDLKGVVGNTIKGALKSIYGTETLDDILYRNYKSDMFELSKIKYNVSLTGHAFDYRIKSIQRKMFTWWVREYHNGGPIFESVLLLDTKLSSQLTHFLVNSISLENQPRFVDKKLSDMTLRESQIRSEQISLLM